MRVGALWSIEKHKQSVTAFANKAGRISSTLGFQVSQSEAEQLEISKGVRTTVTADMQNR